MQQDEFRVAHAEPLQEFSLAQNTIKFVWIGDFQRKIFTFFFPYLLITVLHYIHQIVAVYVFLYIKDSENNNPNGTFHTDYLPVHLQILL